MTRLSILFALLGTIVLLDSCTTVIDAKLNTGPTQLSVDASLTDQPGPQTIRLTQTAAYFDNSTPPAATSATVNVIDDAGKTYKFLDPDNDGYYVWQPTGNDTLGHIGRTYQLTIGFQGETYRAVSKMNRVPSIDSLIFVKRKRSPFSKIEGYRAEFYAMDIPNQTDYYRVRFFQNGQLQNKPGNIVTSQDGGFRSGTSVTDGLMFIAPIRRSINIDSLYNMNDVVKVELQSLTSEAFDFWQQFRTQITNGGLFATPPANIPTNIINTNASGRTAVGFFITSAVRSRTATVNQANIRVRED
ncbi:MULTISPECIES: DUF4249 domain-containing protein [unclassified Spirosoma]|uniref:DUF4249 domain-containing protein n=1 Tax=unclassified Spirosoma TaxID=2621999 RepID=UPI000964666F|nr:MULTISPECIES: DUF4249 domain-containing protein [unclassified Spirosoma]MBN8823161.1 DUF4249 domain-containing protein [Spirosoma sp.]OJW73245.1 MAG: hypothetical protein BGO59_07120 [Spirosoma sp. 48-14]